MPEPIMTIGLGALAAYLSKDGLNKLLGPTAEYLGDGLKDLAQKRTENLAKIFKNSEEKLGKKIDEPGRIPPRVLKTIIDDGSYSEEEVAVEYFGGVLSSSRTDSGRDDRGANIGKLVSRLSVYQLRLHYLIYTLIRLKFEKSGYLFNMNDRPKMKIFIPHIVYILAMKFSEEENKSISSIFNHSFFGLSNENLIDGFQYGKVGDIKKSYPEAKDGGILVSPSALGAELYLWGFGHGNEELKFIFNSPKFKLLDDVDILEDGVEVIHKITSQ